MTGEKVARTTKHVSLGSMFLHLHAAVGGLLRRLQPVLKQEIFAFGFSPQPQPLP